MSNQESEGSSDLESDYYEEEDENSSEETDWKDEKIPNEGQVFETESSDFGSAFVGTITFSLTNLRE